MVKSQDCQDKGLEFDSKIRSDFSSVRFISQIPFLAGHIKM